MQELINLLKVAFSSNVLTEVIVNLIAGLAVGLLVLSVQQLRLKIRAPQEKPYSQRLAELSESLVKASSEVDNLLSELTKIAGDREENVRRLETELTQLEKREKQLQQRIQDLEKVPVPVAEHFAALIARGEKKSAWRDYILFGAGVLVAVLLRLVGIG